MAYPRKNLPRRVGDKSPYEAIVDWAATGLSEAEIARNLGMGKDAFRALKNRDRHVADAIETGRLREERDLRNVLLDAARGVESAAKKNLSAAMFLLKTRHGYREHGEPTNGDGKQVPQVKFPQPVSLDAFLAALAAAAAPPRAEENPANG